MQRWIHLTNINLFNVDSSSTLTSIFKSKSEAFVSSLGDILFGWPIAIYIEDEPNILKLVKLSISCKPLTQQHQSHQELCTFRQDTLTDILCFPVWEYSL